MKTEPPKIYRICQHCSREYRLRNPGKMSQDDFTAVTCPRCGQLDRPFVRVVREKAGNSTTERR